MFKNRIAPEATDHCRQCGMRHTERKQTTPKTIFVHWTQKLRLVGPHRFPVNKRSSSAENLATCYSSIIANKCTRGVVNRESCIFFHSSHQTCKWEAQSTLNKSWWIWRPIQTFPNVASKQTRSSIGLRSKNAVHRERLIHHACHCTHAFFYDSTWLANILSSVCFCFCWERELKQSVRKQIVFRSLSHPHVDDAIQQWNRYFRQEIASISISVAGELLQIDTLISLNHRCRINIFLIHSTCGTCWKMWRRMSSRGNIFGRIGSLSTIPTM